MGALVFKRLEPGVNEVQGGGTLTPRTFELPRARSNFSWWALSRSDNLRPFHHEREANMGRGAITGSVRWQTLTGWRGYAHRQRAEMLIGAFYALAGVAAVAIAAQVRWARLALPLSATTLLGAVAVLGLGGWIAYAGGKVRHREFRNEPPPVDAV
jgi:hypothetical protein